jgi:uncharacterized protein
MAQPGAFAAAYGSWAAVIGAGQGIGLAFARQIAARGVHLLLVDLREDLLERARGELAGADVEVRSAVLDVAAPDAAARLRAALSGTDVGLGVFSAVRSLVGPFLDERLETHLASVAVNCAGAVVTCHVLGEVLRRRGRGGLILLSSLAGLQGTGWVASYAAAKAFDLTLAESLWWELAPHGVDVLGLVAGATDTPGFREHGPRFRDAGAALQSPDEVAAEGLASLGRGPRVIVGEPSRRIVQALEGLAPDVRTRMMSEGTRRLYEG